MEASVDTVPPGSAMSAKKLSFDEIVPAARVISPAVACRFVPVIAARAPGEVLVNVVESMVTVHDTKSDFESTPMCPSVVMLPESVWPSWSAG
jgi:hypothetical protein